MMRVFIIFLLCLVLSGCSFLPPGVMSGLLPDDPAPAPVESKADHVSIQADQRATVINSIENHGTMHLHLNSAPAPPKDDPGPQAQAEPDPDPDKKKDYVETKVRMMASEGFRSRIYADQNNLPHIGYGTNLSTGISEQEALDLFNRRFDFSVEDLRDNIFPGVWAGLPLKARSVLIDMHYHFGSGSFRNLKFLQGVTASAKQRDWQGMAEKMKRSSWAEKFPKRSQGLVEIIQSIEKRN